MLLLTTDTVKSHKKIIMGTSYSSFCGAVSNGVPVFNRVINGDKYEKYN